MLGSSAGLEALVDAVLAAADVGGLGLQAVGCLMTGSAEAGLLSSGGLETALVGLAVVGTVLAVVVAVLAVVTAALVVMVVALAVVTAALAVVVAVVVEVGLVVEGLVEAFSGLALAGGGLVGGADGASFRPTLSPRATRRCQARQDGHAGRGSLRPEGRHGLLSRAAKRAASRAAP